MEYNIMARLVGRPCSILSIVTEGLYIYVGTEGL